MASDGAVRVRLWLRDEAANSYIAVRGRGVTVRRSGTGHWAGWRGSAGGRYNAAVTGYCGSQREVMPETGNWWRKSETVAVSDRKERTVRGGPIAGENLSASMDDRNRRPVRRNRAGKPRLLPSVRRGSPICQLHRRKRARVADRETGPTQAAEAAQELIGEANGGILMTRYGGRLDTVSQGTPGDIHILHGTEEQRQLRAMARSGAEAPTEALCGEMVGIQQGVGRDNKTLRTPEMQRRLCRQCHGIHAGQALLQPFG